MFTATPQIVPAEAPAHNASRKFNWSDRETKTEFPDCFENINVKIDIGKNIPQKEPRPVIKQ